MVSVVSESGADYPPDDDGFSPSEPYPEYEFGAVAGRPNSAYALVRSALRGAGLDAARFGSREWNPLGEALRPGQSVFLLCNLVYHRRPSESPEDFFSKCTHGSVIRAVIDYALKAVGPSGRILVGNAPLQSCDWERVLTETGVRDAVGFHERRGSPVQAADLRLRVAQRNAVGRVTSIRMRDESDGVEIDLGRDSLLAGMADGRPDPGFRVSDYDPRRTRAFHSGGAHRYVIHRAILGSDAIISVPKLKTHEKVGLTCVLKGFVGMVGHKDCLAHHRFGNPSRGGDEYPDRFAFLRPVSAFHDWVHGRDRTAPLQAPAEIIDRAMRHAARRLGLLTAGAWHGNDTAWRMTLDLARIAHFADSRGVMRSEPQRTHLALIDGIIAGEGPGPLAPRPFRAGSVLFSDSALEADWGACRLMGFDPAKIPLLSKGNEAGRWTLPGAGRPEAGGLVINGRAEATGSLGSLLARPFEPPSGWIGALGRPA
jgi:uncharacterized protein (DUF362 family)